jgi:hypothetical protein
MLSAPVHVRHSYTLYGQSPYVATFHESSTELNRSTAPRKRAHIPIHSTSASQSTGLDPVSLPQQSLKQWEKVKHLLATSYISLLGSYVQHVISTFNTCSLGPTHRSLTNTGGRYNLWGSDFPHHTPRPSQPTVLRFFLMVPPVSV